MRAIFLTILFQTMRILLILKKLKFERVLNHPEKAQEKTLKRIVRAMAATEFGKHYRLNSDDSYESFSKKIPISAYDDLKPWIERQIQSKERILLNEKILFYEKTSGSSGPYKLIPYTQAHLNSFHHMFLLWFNDVVSNGPRFNTGKIFLSLSPYLFVPEKSEANIQIGQQKDEDYLPLWLQLVFKSFWILPLKVAKLRNAENFKRAAALYLLNAEDLEVVLIWSPSFLTNLLDFADKNREMLYQDLVSQSIELEGMVFDFKKTSQKVLKWLQSDQDIPWASLWPSLKFISCWDNAFACSTASYLRSLFPKTFVQGKGLLATEGVMTLPLMSAQGFVPLLDSVFFEFETETGKILKLTELEAGKTYQIICSFPGGFARYRIGDMIRVTHFYRKTPCFEFLGRAGMTSDLVGEKLTEPFVREVIEELPLKGSRFQLLAPVLDERPPYYQLLIDGFLGDQEACEEKLDLLLQKSHRYKAARLLGQLGSAKIKIDSAAEENYLEYFVKRGMKRGNVKHRYLFNQSIEELSSNENRKPIFQ